MIKISLPKAFLSIFQSYFMSPVAIPDADAIPILPPFKTFIASKPKTILTNSIFFGP
jgi:hypothetical protein